MSAPALPRETVSVLSAADPRDRPAAALRALRGGAATWLVIALCGQWLFALYIAALYAWPLLTGNAAAANLARPITGYVAGDLLGNTMLFAHVLPAIALSIGGVLQLIPGLRRRWPLLHRWNGRLFFLMGAIGALSGLYLTWVRGSRLSDLGAIGITLNGVLIPLAIALAWRCARQRRFDAHRRWATHAFLLINGVWTFRLYLMAWYVGNGGPNGNTNTLDGPVDLFLSFACYALPMLVAELYFWALRQRQSGRQWFAATIMATGCLVTAMGVISAAMAMWWPRIERVLAVA